MSNKIHESKVPIWNKYALSIEEAADYFGIGQKKLRKIVDEDPTAEYVLKNGAFTKVFGPNKLHLGRRNTYEG